MICGIDPGLNGGIAFISKKDVYAVRIPLYKIKIGGKVRSFLDLPNILDLIDEHKTDRIYIEKQQAMPSQGVSSTFKTGFNYGIYIGSFVALGYDYIEVTPRQWKKDLEVPADKELSMQRASELMPEASGQWPFKAYDGVAEAAMIAYWGLNCGQ